MRTEEAKGKERRSTAHPVTKENGSDEGGQKKRRKTEVTEEEGDAGGGVWESLHEIEGKY